MEIFYPSEPVVYDKSEWCVVALKEKWPYTVFVHYVVPSANTNPRSHDFDPPPFDPGPLNRPLTSEQRQKQQQKREEERRRVEEERRRDEERQRLEKEEERQRQERQRKQKEESAWVTYHDSAAHVSPDLVSQVTSDPRFAAEPRDKQPTLREAVAHQLLLKEGGRPLCSYETFLEIARNPEENYVMLMYWQRPVSEWDRDSWAVFSFQLERWRNFRAWQEETRQKHPISEYISLTKAYLAKYSTQDMVDMLVLEKDPKDQDRLSTWIEYLSFEMRGYYEIAWSKSKASQLHHTAAWRRRANHGALTRRHTRTYIENPVYDQGRSRGLRRQRKAAEAERLAHLARARRDALPPARAGPSRRRRNSLDEEDLDWSRGRSDGNGGWGSKVEKYLDTTENYTIARRQVRQQDMLLEWIKSEAYKIRDEMKAVREREWAAFKERKRAARRQRQQELQRECDERLARIETILFGPDTSLHPTVQYYQSLQAAAAAAAEASQAAAVATVAEANQAAAAATAAAEACHVAAEACLFKRPRTPGQEPEDAPKEKAVCLHSTQFLSNLTFRPRTQEAAQAGATTAGPSSADTAMSTDGASSAADTSDDEF